MFLCIARRSCFCDSGFDRYVVTKFGVHPTLILYKVYDPVHMRINIHAMWLVRDCSRCGQLCGVSESDTDMCTCLQSYMRVCYIHTASARLVARP